jgi:tetratricopeptide (TPR) repeat protein
MQVPASFWRLLAGVAVAVLVAARALTAQEFPSKKPGKFRPPAQIPAKLKLTQQQEQGLRLLREAQAEAAGSQPDMHSFVLWQVSHGYARIDSAKADSLLKEAFRITLSIENSYAESERYGEAEFGGAKNWLQKHILRELIERSHHPGQVQPLLAVAVPEVREMMSPELFRHYINEKEFDQARAMLNQFAEQDYYPYESATELMLALPRERYADRLEIFSQALNSFAQYTGEFQPQSYDLSTMVFRFWHELPASVVLEAIDQILDRAKEADKTQQNIRVGISTQQSDAYFASQYQFRLFQLVPVLEELDQLQAESLLRENSEVRTALERYPQGLGSMDPGSNRDTPSKGKMPEILSMGPVAGDNTAEAAAEQSTREIIRRQDRIFAEAEKDPKRALSDTMNLPLSEEYGRTSALHQVARITAAKDPIVCKAAMQEMRKLVDNMSLRNQALMLADSPEIYLRLGDEDESRKALDELLTIAAKLYSHDTDPSDPNQAFKAWWPSADLWRRSLQFATKLNPSPAQEIIAQIPDAEIKSFERVVFASTLLGADVLRLSIIEAHKNTGFVYILP